LLVVLVEVETNELTEGGVECSVIVKILREVVVRRRDGRIGVMRSGGMVELGVIVELMVTLIQSDEEPTREGQGE
jgi:hypothetical protein